MNTHFEWLENLKASTLARIFTVTAENIFQEKKSLKSLLEIKNILIKYNVRPHVDKQSIVEEIQTNLTKEKTCGSPKTCKMRKVFEYTCHLIHKKPFKRPVSY